MKCFTCISTIKDESKNAIAYNLQDDTGRIIQISAIKLATLLSLNKITIVNLILSNNKIIKNPYYDIESMISKLKILGDKSLITCESHCKHNYYIIKNKDITTVYIPSNVKCIISEDNTDGKARYNKIQCNQLKVIGGDGLISAFNLFYTCKAKSLDITHLTTTNIKTMDNMFCWCEAKEIKLGSMDTANVESMKSMFRGCLAQKLDLRSFNTSKVTNMKSMFAGCKSRILRLDSFNTLNVENMDSMFYNCAANKLDLTSFKLGDKVDTHLMFLDTHAVLKVTDSKLEQIYNDEQSKR